MFVIPEPAKVVPPASESNMDWRISFCLLLGRAGSRKRDSTNRCECGWRRRGKTRDIDPPLETGSRSVSQSGVPSGLSSQAAHPRRSLVRERKCQSLHTRLWQHPFVDSPFEFVRRQVSYSSWAFAAWGPSPIIPALSKGGMQTSFAFVAARNSFAFGLSTAPFGSKKLRILWQFFQD